MGILNQFGTNILRKIDPEVRDSIGKENYGTFATSWSEMGHFRTKIGKEKFNILLRGYGIITI